MKRIVGILLLSVVFIGCKGQKGDQGDKGQAGTLNTYTGLITSDSQMISVGGYTASSDISVFVGDGTNFIECPYYAPPLSLNVYYSASNFFVILFNAKTAAATNYKIVVINAVASSGLKERLLD